MSNTNIKKKIFALEVEIKILRDAIFKKKIDFDADDRVWNSMKSTSKRSRSSLFRKIYA
jgi:hypothetical protein